MIKKIIKLLFLVSFSAQLVAMMPANQKSSRRALPPLSINCDARPGASPEKFTYLIERTTSPDASSSSCDSPELLLSTKEILERSLKSYEAKLAEFSTLRTDRPYQLYFFATSELEQALIEAGLRDKYDELLYRLQYENKITKRASEEEMLSLYEQIAQKKRLINQYSLNSRDRKALLKCKKIIRNLRDTKGDPAHQTPEAALRHLIAKEKHLKSEIKIAAEENEVDHASECIKKFRDQIRTHRNILEGAALANHAHASTAADNILRKYEKSLTPDQYFMLYNATLCMELLFLTNQLKNAEDYTHKKNSAYEIRAVMQTIIWGYKNEIQRLKQILT